MSVVCLCVNVGEGWLVLFLNFCFLEFGLKLCYREVDGLCVFWFIDKD